MEKLAEDFEQSQPISVSDIVKRRRTFGNNARITRNGKLYGATNIFNELLSVRGSILKDGRKIIAVGKTNANDISAVKSSTESTKIPFINVSNLCMLWFGDDCDNWKKKLKFCGNKEGVDYYEVIESAIAKDPEGESKKWFYEMIDYIKQNNKVEFDLDDIYKFEPELATIHPSNTNIKSSIRKTIQMLRDTGLVIGVKGEKYRMSPKFVGERYSEIRV